jgi:hypothetical protein
MWVVGARRMAAARRQQKTSLLPRVGLTTDRLMLRWQF